MSKGFVGAILVAALLGIGAYAAISGMGPDRTERSAQGNAGNASDGAKATAIFAGGCFWCLEQAMDEVPGVLATTSGYIGGSLKDPTYPQVSAGGTGHTEAVKIVYDPSRIGYDNLLEAFWHNIDPLTANAQFCDKGSQYRAGIFFTNETQKQLAEASRAALVKARKFKQPIVTEITKAGRFYDAEDYHQDYYTKNPVRYKYYKYACGRAQRLEKLWGPKPS